MVVTCGLCTAHVIMRMHSKLYSLHNEKTLFSAYNMAYYSS